MRLEQSDAALFYQLWFLLLDFVNRKYHVCPETETIDQRQGVDARDAKKIATHAMPRKLRTICGRTPRLLMSILL